MTSNYIEQINDSVGQTMTLKVVSNDGVNKWGDAKNESTTSRDITATPEILGNTAEEVQEGDYEAGDLRIYVSTNENDIVEGNRIVYQNDTYQIDNVEKHVIGDESHYEVRCGQV